jgi:hypothetical protein
MGDDSIVNKYEILTVNHEEIGMLQIEGKDKVGVIWATSYFDFAQGGATRDDANDIILEVQIQFVPESKAISPMFPETKKVGSKTIKLDSRQTTTFGTTWVEFTLMIDYGTVGFVPTQPPIEISKMPTQEVVAAIVPEQVDSADTDILGYGLGMAIVIGVTVIVCLLIIRLKKKTKNTQQEPSSAIQAHNLEYPYLRYQPVLEQWLPLLPVLAFLKFRLVAELEQILPCHSQSSV